MGSLTDCVTRNSYALVSETASVCHIRIFALPKLFNSVHSVTTLVFSCTDPDAAQPPISLLWVGILFSLSHFFAHAVVFKFVTVVSALHMHVVSRT